MPNASGDEVLPEHAIFRFELIGEFPQQLFYPPRILAARRRYKPRSDMRPLGVSPTLFPLGGAAGCLRLVPPAIG